MAQAIDRGCKGFASELSGLGFGGFSKCSQEWSGGSGSLGREYFGFQVLKVDQGTRTRWGFIRGFSLSLKETTGGEFRVYRASVGLL